MENNVNILKEENNKCLGGTELMLQKIVERVDLSNFNIITDSSK